MTQQLVSAERRRSFLSLAAHPLGWSIVVAAAFVYVCVRLGDSASLGPALFVFLPLAVLANVLAGQARLRAAESEALRREVDDLARQQTALRRVATLVAGAADPSVVYPVAVTEMARGLGVQHVTLTSFEPADRCVVLAAHDEQGVRNIPVGEQLSLAGDSVTARVLRTGEPARIDDYTDVDGSIATRMRGLGLRAGVGSPVNVNGQPRCALIVGCAHPDALSAEIDSRISDFAELVGAAIKNAETRSELQASRARLVAAADQARRGFERDLHDGAQQRIASLGLGLRALESSVPDEQVTVRKQIANLVNGMADLYTDLSELSRGIHPAILSRAGLGPAIKSLARRSTVPVRLDLGVNRRLPESIELAGYYVIAEALANVVKHADANEVTVRACFDGDELRLEVSDDGVGGARSGEGSGLVGLRDRVEAVSGRLELMSAVGSGTTVTARIPVPACGDDEAVG